MFHSFILFYVTLFCVFFLFYIVRYFLIAVPALYFVNTGQYILHSNWWGKWSTGITALTVFLHMFEFGTIWWLKTFSLYTALALAVVSWFLYYRDYYKVIKEQ